MSSGVPSIDIAFTSAPRISSSLITGNVPVIGGFSQRACCRYVAAQIHVGAFIQQIAHGVQPPFARRQK